MKIKFVFALPTIILLCPLMLWAQITTTTRPENWYSSTLLQACDFDRVKLPHNSKEAVLDELFNDVLIKKIAKAVGLTDEHLAKVRIFKHPEYENFFDFIKLDKPSDQNPLHLDPLYNALNGYITARYEGRTKESMQAALTNLTPLAEIEDPAIRAIVEKYPLTPASWLRKEKSGNDKSTTTINGKKYKTKGWAVYYLVDEDIAWRYYVNFKAKDGAVFSVCASRLDAKEYDKKYAELFKRVEAEVEREMKKRGIKGLGSIHTFWRLKKDKLKKEGILWRSPSELNPGTNYD